MSEFENDFDNDEAVTAAFADTIAEEMEAMESETQATISEAAGQPIEVVIVDGEDAEDGELVGEPEDDDFFAEDEAAEIPDVDPATIITIRTSQGSDVFVPAPAPMPLVDAIAKSGLRFNGDFTCWLNGQEVGLGTQVAGGMTVTVVGSVKGGAR